MYIWYMLYIYISYIICIHVHIISSHIYICIYIYISYVIPICIYTRIYHIWYIYVYMYIMYYIYICVYICCIHVYIFYMYICVFLRCCWHDADVAKVVDRAESSPTQSSKRDLRLTGVAIWLLPFRRWSLKRSNIWYLSGL